MIIKVEQSLQKGMVSMKNGKMSFGEWLEEEIGVT